MTDALRKTRREWGRWLRWSGAVLLVGSAPFGCGSADEAEPEAQEECVSDEDCDDGDVCTEDTCVQNICENRDVSESVPQCAPACTTANDCDDLDACTMDECVEDNGTYECVHSSVDCCSEDSQCNDDNDCTSDYCIGGTCVNARLDCNDDDACTADICHADGSCTHGPVSCDDGDECTDDTCTARGGCKNLALTECMESSSPLAFFEVDPISFFGVAFAEPADQAEADVLVDFGESVTVQTIDEGDCAEFSSDIPAGLPPGVDGGDASVTAVPWSGSFTTAAMDAPDYVKSYMGALAPMLGAGAEIDIELAGNAGAGFPALSVGSYPLPPQPTLLAPTLVSSTANVNEGEDLEVVIDDATAAGEAEILELVDQSAPFAQYRCPLIAASHSTIVSQDLLGAAPRSFTARVLRVSVVQATDPVVITRLMSTATVFDIDVN